jgi:hypothetical protein
MRCKEERCASTIDSRWRSSRASRASSSEVRAGAGPYAAYTHSPRVERLEPSGQRVRLHGRTSAPHGWRGQQRCRPDLHEARTQSESASEIIRVQQASGRRAPRREPCTSQDCRLCATEQQKDALCLCRAGDFDPVHRRTALALLVHATADARHETLKGLVNDWVHGRRRSR